MVVKRHRIVIDPETGRAWPVPQGGSGDPPPPAEDTESEGEVDEGSGADDDEDVRDPKTRKLSRENANLRVRMKELEARLAALEGAGEPEGPESSDDDGQGPGAGQGVDDPGADGRAGSGIQEPSLERGERIELALRRAGEELGVPIDQDVVRLLGPHVFCDETGQPVKVAELIREYQERYPSLFQPVSTPPGIRPYHGGSPPPPGRSGDPTAGRVKKKEQGLNREELESKYPSLRRRVASYR